MYENFTLGDQGKFENKIFEQRPNGREAAENVLTWGKGISGRQNSKCKSPVVKRQLLQE